MKKEIYAQTARLYERLRDLSSDGEWRDELRDAFSEIEFTEAQHQAILEAGTPTFMGRISSGQNGEEVYPVLEEELTHAFTDAVRNCVQCIDIISDPGTGADEEFSLGVMVRTRNAIRDVVHNYPLLLGERIPQSVDDILAAYEDEVLPVLDDLVGKLAQDSGIDLDTIRPSGSWQHLTQLPVGVFEVAQDADLSMAGAVPEFHR